MGCAPAAVATFQSSHSGPGFSCMSPADRGHLQAPLPLHRRLLGQLKAGVNTKKCYKLAECATMCVVVFVVATDTAVVVTVATLFLIDVRILLIPNECVKVVV